MVIIDEAKNYLLNIIENDVKHEAAIMVRDIEAKAKMDADKKSKGNGEKKWKIRLLPTTTK